MQWRPRLHLAQTPERPGKGPRFVEKTTLFPLQRQYFIGICRPRCAMFEPPAIGRINRSDWDPAEEDRGEEAWWVL